MKLIAGSKSEFNAMDQFCADNNIQKTLRDQDDMKNRVRYLQMLKTCTELVVWNQNGIIGPSVTAEIALALAWNKRVSYVYDMPLANDVLCLHKFFDSAPRIFGTGGVIIP